MKAQLFLYHMIVILLTNLQNKVFDLNINGGQMFLGDYQYYEKTEEAAAIKAHETVTQNNFENKEINQDANTSTYISQKQQKDNNVN